MSKLKLTTTKVRRKAFLFSILLMGPALFGSEHKCSDVYMQNERLNSLINQMDPQFKKYELLEDDGSSQLCGITSLANFINYKVALPNHSLSKDELIKFISEESINFMYEQRMNGDRSFSIKGMFSFNLALLSQRIIKKLNLKYDIYSKSELLADQEIKKSDLVKAKLGIWSLQFINGQTKKLGPSHFVLVVDFSNAKNEVTFIDPLDPTKMKFAKLLWRPTSKTNARSPLTLVLGQNSEMKLLVNDEVGYYEISGIVGFRPK